MSTEVAKKKETAVSTDLLDQMMSDEGAGVDFNVNDMEVPFVRLAHPMSDVMNKTKPSFMKELRSGEIYNSVTKQIWDPEKGITVVPVHQETIYTHKMDEKIIGRYTMADTELATLLKRVTREGAKEYVRDANGHIESELVKSDNFYCVIIDEDGSTQKAIIDFRSTGLKVSRRWKTQISMQKVQDSQGNYRTPPLYGVMWSFTGVDEANDKGAWSSWSISKIGVVDRADVFAEAKMFREQIMKGEVKAQQEDEPIQDSAPAGNDIPPQDDDIPF